VLTGGSSTRMGTDKALVEVDGIPMAERVAGALQDAGCDPVVFVGGRPEPLDRLGRLHVPDTAPGAGPAGGIMSALRALGDDVQWVLIASCDLPYLRAAHLLPLVDAVPGADGSDVDVVVASTDRRQPLCALWSSTTSAKVAEAFGSGVRSVFGLLDGLRVIEVPVEHEGLRNVNTAADLRDGPGQH
jgi:molybdopterin-guanine dinucleotide biosynthesis protein A